jgi:hypothetical protein
MRGLGIHALTPPCCPPSTDADQSAVWRGAEAVVPRLLMSNRADEWLSGDTYRDTGPAAADDVRYIGSM